MKKIALTLVGFLLSVSFLMAQQQPKGKQIRTIDSLQTFSIIKESSGLPLKASVESLKLPQEIILEKDQKIEKQSIITDSLKPAKAKLQYETLIAKPLYVDKHAVFINIAPEQEKAILQQDTNNKQPQSKK